MCGSLINVQVLDKIQEEKMTCTTYIYIVCTLISTSNGFEDSGKLLVLVQCVACTDGSFRGFRGFSSYCPIIQNKPEWLFRREG